MLEKPDVAVSVSVTVSSETGDTHAGYVAPHIAEPARASAEPIQGVDEAASFLGALQHFLFPPENLEEARAQACPGSLPPAPAKACAVLQDVKAAFGTEPDTFVAKVAESAAVLGSEGIARANSEAPQSTYDLLSALRTLIHTTAVQVETMPEEAFVKKSPSTLLKLVHFSSPDLDTENGREFAPASRP